MKEKDVIKALECCNSGADSCPDECPYHSKEFKHKYDCLDEENGLVASAIKIINIQTAEIERLQKYNTDVAFKHSCKVGDKVYCLHQQVKDETKIIEFEIDTLEIHKDYIIIDGFIGEHCYRYFTHEIGKTVFLTREAAENALKERVQG